MSSAVEALNSLKSCLEDLQAKGQTHVSFHQDARDTLASLPARLRQLTSPPSASPRVNESTATTASPAPSLSPPPAATVSSNKIIPSGNTPAEKIASLAALAANWKPARSLGSLRDTMVFSVGNPQANLMLVGEAPGADEESQEEPFVGKAGQLLTKILNTMGLERTDVYISNICKFRPATADQFKANRKPSPEEMEACLPFVIAEIDVVHPDVIVALGATAAAGLLDLHEPVSRMRGRFHALNDTPVMVTYHPSYLLRNQAPAERRKVWEDMLMVMEKLSMPITEKQRNFFRTT